MLILLVVCAVSILCIILKYNRSTQNELRKVKEKLKSVEMSAMTGSESNLNVVETETYKSGEVTDLNRIASVSSIRKISNAGSVDNFGTTEQDDNGEDGDSD